jgi:hypothetical protein
MKDAKYRFMCGVLGEDGAKALTKAAERHSSLHGAILPRTIIAWLGISSQYEGELPGVDNTYISFTKSEGKYNGTISINDEIYPLSAASLFHTAAAVAVALGAAPKPEPALRDLDLAKLGKSIDLLAKAKVVALTLSKAEPPGPAHAPTKQDGPVEAQVPVKQSRIPHPQPKRTATVAAPPVPKLRVRIPGLRPKLHIAKSQVDNECSACGGTQFKADRFAGCICFRDLAKSVSVKEQDGGYNLTFGADWDNDSIAVLIDALGVK